ncbi:hypothetical protein F3Y22_tig00111772pilonHSYRG00285 [Hibiscus syriacus]|uniref:Uncharacterized protein n=1 Tax=Hibiscus syriacus TaxID=106335 RepID=A0A6A2YFN3_HIBSY|nr:hypothetical protein F3Y22_tig00111772pilonHSYRG00285 [Hibiscus syriacus]
MDFTTGSKSFSHKKVNVVLDEINFLLWKQQILLTIRSHRLERLLTGDVVTPSETVVDDDGIVCVNEACEDFVAQDSALATWLLSTIILIFFLNSSELKRWWPSGIQLFSFFYSLDDSCHEPSLKTLVLKKWRRQYACLRDSCEGGLPQEYQSFMEIITSMRENLSFDCIYTMLLDAETQLASFDNPLETLPMSANIAQGEIRSSSMSIKGSDKRSIYLYGSRAGGRGRGRYRVQCQLYGKVGHLVDRCWHRYDQDFSSVTSINHGQYQTNYKDTSSIVNFTVSSTDGGYECFAKRNTGSVVVDGGFQHTFDDVDTTASENVALMETDGVSAESSDDYDSVGGDTIAIYEPDVNVPPSHVHPMMTRLLLDANGYFVLSTTLMGRFINTKHTWLPNGSLKFSVRMSTCNNPSTLFLNGDLSEDVYMQQPPGLEQVDEHGKALVYKLQKALYGLYYAPRNQHVKLKDNLFFESEKYILELLEKTGMSNAAGCATPMVVSSKLSHEDGELLLNASEYRSIVVYLLYVCHTRPDISFSVGQVDQYMHTPREAHFVAVKRILRYLSSTLDIVAFTDADWGASIDDRHSITRYGDEYKSVVEAATDITWVNVLLTDLDIQQCHEPVVWCDNTSDVAMSVNPVYHAQSKHVDLDVHFVREKVAAGQLCASYVPAMHQIADGFTKETTQLSKQHKRLSVRDLASKFDKNLATAMKLADEANLREVASLEGHAILKKLRGALKSLRGCADKTMYAPEPLDVGRLLQAEILSNGQKVSVTTANPFDSG